MKGPLICKALIAQPFFIRSPTPEPTRQGGFAGEPVAPAGERGAGFLEGDPPCLTCMPFSLGHAGRPAGSAPAGVVTIIRLLDNLTRSVRTSQC